jgi:hypothetical protein
VLTEKLLPRVVDSLFEDHVIEILVSLETSTRLGELLTPHDSFSLETARHVNELVRIVY